VTLLGESGQPVWWRYLPRRIDARTMLAMDEVFHVYAGKQPGMIELLPAAPKRYRLRAQVQHIHSWTLQGQVGIYFAHGKRPTEEGATHCFFRVAFNDRLPSHPRPDERVPTESSVKPRPDKRDLTRSSVNLHLPIFYETKGDGFSRQTYASCAIARDFTPTGEAQPMPWRTLEVEVTPEWIKTFWEGKLIESTLGGKEADGIDPKRVLETAEIVLSVPQKQPLSDAELTLGEGIGLYVEKGIAAFKSVVIEPLPQQ